jgi:uncharacterized SAM-binding protein YcdF (DUF218 family)
LKITKFKKLKRVIIVLVSIVFILVASEIAYFYYILSQDVELEKADVIVVFAGSEDRIRAGFKLANAGYAPVLIVSPATESQMENYKSRYVDLKTVSWIIEDKARTTSENALFTKNIILKNGFKSAILVTSYYHLPRSFFLMKVALLGNRIRIQPYGKSISLKIANDHRSTRIFDDLIYHEFIELWGSLSELLMHKVKDEISA